MRAEWARTRARAAHWGEEVELLQEEMRRVIEFFEHKARWWREQVVRRTSVAPALARGLAAYAEKQAAVFDSLALDCATLWVPYLKSIASVPEWAARYNVPDNLGRRRARVVARARRVIDEGTDSESDEEQAVEDDENEA